MKKFHLYLEAKAYVGAYVTIEADTEEDARKEVLNQLGDVEWSYHGVLDETVEVINIKTDE